MTEIMTETEKMSAQHSKELLGPWVISTFSNISAKLSKKSLNPNPNPVLAKISNPSPIQIRQKSLNPVRKSPNPNPCSSLVVTGLDCDTIQVHHERFSSFMKCGLPSHICCGCRRMVGNILLIVLSFLNFRRDRFERGNFVLAKTTRVFTNSRSSKAS